LNSQHLRSYYQSIVRSIPYLVCVAGLKNSGKTTVCTAIISDLASRGYSVAALKSSHVARLTLDHSATDSYALAESGACFVLVQSREESLILERSTRTFAEMIRRVPDNVQFIICEGGEAQKADAVVVCLSDASKWAESLRVRRIPENKILGLAGPFASPASSIGQNFKGLPVFDVREAGGRESLVGLIEKRPASF
jgi:molybdopterin-guanine dinucleotide biosynthesis protein MobB